MSRNIGSKINLLCAFCDKKFRFESERKRHELSHSVLFQCKVCHKSFSFESALKRHEKQHKRNGKVFCEQCSHTFKDDILLERHMKYAHKGLFKCHLCDTVLHSEKALSNHLKTHRPKSERKYKCKHCDKSFNFSHHLKHHELTHTDIKPHCCSHCGKGFIQLQHYKTHLKTHDHQKVLKSKEQNLIKKISTKSSRKRHTKKHDTNKCELFEKQIFKKSLGFQRSKFIQDTLPDSPSAQEIVTKVTYINTKINNDLKNDLEISETENHVQISALDLSLDCKSVLGGCIVTGETEITDTCLCAKISNKSVYTNDTINKRDKNIPDIKFNDLNNKKQWFIDVDDLSRSNEYTSDSTETKCCSKFKEYTAIMPKIRYRVDGVIQLDEMIDSSIISFNENINVEKKGESSFKQMPLNSCKSIFGTCMVSGNDTIGDGCICARISMDVQQVTAQEIDEITIVPAC